MKKILTTLALSLTSFVALSHNINIGEPLPSVSITDKGYVEMVNGEIGYRNWSSSEFNGKVLLVQHIAGRTAAKELNAPMIDAVKAANFSLDTYNTATIVNVDEAIWGTGSIVASNLRSNKEDFPEAIFIMDDNGNARSTWELESESSAMILLNKEGKVLYVKDGEMDPTEIAKVIQLIKVNI